MIYLVFDRSMTSLIHLGSRRSTVSTPRSTFNADARLLLTFLSSSNLADLSTSLLSSPKTTFLAFEAHLSPIAVPPTIARVVTQSSVFSIFLPPVTSSKSSIPLLNQSHRKRFISLLNAPRTPVHLRGTFSPAGVTSSVPAGSLGTFKQLATSRSGLWNEKESVYRLESGEGIFKRKEPRSWAEEHEEMILEWGFDLAPVSSVFVFISDASPFLTFVRLPLLVFSSSLRPEPQNLSLLPSSLPSSSTREIRRSRFPPLRNVHSSQLEPTLRIQGGDLGSQYSCYQRSSSRWRVVGWPALDPTGSTAEAEDGWSCEKGPGARRVS